MLTIVRKNDLQNRGYIRAILMTLETIACEIVDSVLNHPDCGKTLHKDRETLLMLIKFDLEKGLRQMFAAKQELENLMKPHEY